MSNDNARKIFPWKQYRNTCFTLNNYTNDEYNKLTSLPYVKYIVFGKEKGDEKNTPHLQGYIEWNSPRRGSAIFKINPRIHWENRIGTAEEASEYCKKQDPNFFEMGNISQQGERNDLKELVDHILKGSTSVDKLVIEQPMAIHQYGRTLERAEEIRMRNIYRTEMTKGIWYWGPTGVGKSHKAFENYSYETHYIYPNDNGWWDEYRQQDTVIINEFRGEITYKQMLELTDKWPMVVKRRNKPPLPFTSKTIIVTSSMPPFMVYKNLAQEDSLDQLMRRFTIIELSGEFATEVL